MQQDRIVLTDELIQRYCDGELEGDLLARVEQTLETDAANSGSLGRYSGLRRLLTEYTQTLEPDELTERRNWDMICRELDRASRPLYRRRLPWISVAVAAALSVFIFGPFQKADGAQAEVESVDCMSSFMLLNPDQAGTHMIIWINDPGN